MAETSIKITKFRKDENNKHSSFNFEPVILDANLEIRKYRQQCLEKFKTTPFPSDKDEDWRRTSLKNIWFDQFSLINQEMKEEQDFPAKLIVPMADKNHGGQVLVSPWHAQSRLDPALQDRGVIFEDIQSAALNHAEILEKVLCRIDHSRSGKFSFLAGALELNGILLYVPKNTTVEVPLQSLYWAPCKNQVHALHVLVYIESGSSVTYVHESSSPREITEEALHTGLMEIHVGEDAHLQFVELQSWGENVINFTRENVEVEQDGSVDWIFGALGSKFTKNFSNLNLIGDGSAGKMSGFYFTDNIQHLDHDTQQNHLAPHTTSDLLFKGALLDQSRSVWQGMIFVAPNASRTDGYQANRNLVLSPKARADSIPGLEILTDDVKCTHGATVGKIDEEQIFYLSSRGIQRDDAERLIVEGFFDPIMQRIPFEGVKNRFQAAIREKMEHIA